jgi:hypothetical protein
VLIFWNMCIDNYYSQTQRDKHRKPVSGGHTMLGPVITETLCMLFSKCNSILWPACMFACVCVCGCARMRARELSDFSDWNAVWTIQHSNPSRNKRLFSSVTCPDWLWDPPSILFSGYNEFFQKGQISVLSGGGYIHLVLRLRNSPCGPSCPVLGWTLTYLYLY